MSDYGKNYIIRVWSGIPATDPSRAIEINPKKFNKYWIWDDATFEGFSKTINGGLGELNLKLARPWDDYGEGEDVALNNRVEIIINSDKSAPEGKRIYNGYISEISPWCDGHNEGVDIKCLGYITKFSSILFLSHIATTTIGTTMTYTATELSEIVKDIVDYVAENTLKGNNKYMDPQNVVTYTEDVTVTKTGHDVSLSFFCRTCLDALNTCLKVNAGWTTGIFYYYLGADGIFYWQKLPDIATHTFVFGKHIKAINLKKSMLNIANQYWGWNGLQESDQAWAANFISAKDIPPMTSDDVKNNAKYGIREKVMEVRNANSTNKTSNSDTINQAITSDWKINNTPMVEAEFELADIGIDPKSGYDIDSIEPGHTCKIVNLPQIPSSFLNNNMIIKKIDYTLDKIKVELALNKTDLQNSIGDVTFDENDQRKVEGPSYMDVQL